MEIVLENPSVAPLSAKTPVSPSTPMDTSQLDLPTQRPPPHHFPRRALLPTRSRMHGLMSPYERDLDSASSAPVTLRRIDKSGLLEIAEMDPAVCPRPRVLTGAEDATARAGMLRIDRSGLLEAVPEAVDQAEEQHCNNANGSIECVTTSDPATAGVVTLDTLDQAVVTLQRNETDASKADAVSDGACRSFCPDDERPSSLEGQACPDEAGSSSSHLTADIKVLTESPRARFGVSTKRSPHLSSFSPGPSLRLSREDNPSRGSSPLAISRCRVDADSAQLRNRWSADFAAKYNPASRNLVSNRQSRSLVSTSDYSSATVPLLTSTTRAITTTTTSSTATTATAISTTRSAQQSQRSYSKQNNATVDSSETPRESLLAKGSAQRKDDDPPDEERAEAEGCEHTVAEGLEEDEVSFKGSNKLLDNDNVQTLRVIILSEQL